MAILVTPQTRVLVQGITGSFGAQHTQLSLDYGSQFVAGVTPGKGGQLFAGQVPVFETVAEAVEQTGATVSVIFVPPALAGDAILEAAGAGLDLIVAITEGIPVNDMVRVKAAHARREVPGSSGRIAPGLVTPGDRAPARMAAAASASPRAISIARGASASSPAPARSLMRRSGN